ncbi:MAG: hypothetical protein H0T89_23145 [Deltaproteobacteria bacterium]|nr:hypothetical protein [Deltaproteobacteria bacterium]MDQ3295001.1 hypothetical protein [Myxococcota bacterium]
MIRAGVSAMLGIASVTLASCTDDGGPRLHAATPASSVAGGMTVLTGTRLCGESGNCATAGGAVRIGLDDAVQANITMYSDTSAEIRIPTVTPVGPTSIVLTVNEKASNTLAFEILPP